MRSFALLLILILCCFAPLHTNAQTFVVVGHKLTNYPNVELQVYGYSNLGIHTVVSNPVVTVDGTEVPAQGVLGPSASPRNISCILMCDASAALNIGSPSNLQITKAVALTATDYDNGLSDEVGLGKFDIRPTLLYGMNQDKLSLIQALDDLKPGVGCNLDSAILENTEGALSHLRSSRNARALILTLTGTPSINAAEIIRTARNYRVAIYIVGIRTALTSDVRSLADSTGGLYIENINNEEDAQDFTRAFISHAKQTQQTLITFTMPDACTSTREVTVTWTETKRSVTLTLPSNTLPTLAWSEPGGVDFGTGTAASERTVQLTALVNPVTITNIAISNPAFTLVEPIPAGTVIQPNQSLSVRIGYLGSTSGVAGSITITSDACVYQPLYLRGGSYISGDKLELTTPNGGEQLKAGVPYNITWANVLPADVVRLDRSSDGGVTWTPITETASGLQYQWNAGPGTGSNMMIRVQRTSLSPDAIITLAGHREPVYSAAFSHDGSLVISGGHDGTVRVWNAVTGEQIRELGIHGAWVWTVTTHPTTMVGVSGGHDGIVRAYQLETGERLQSITAPSRVWSVRFSPDGSTLAVGTDKAISIYSWPDMNLVNSIAVDGGPVYSVKFSADGTYIVTAEASKTVVRKTSDYQVVASFDAAPATVYAADISPDNSTVATGGSDFVVRTWNLTSGAIRKTSAPSIASILSLEFANAGSKLLVGGGDGTAKTFKTSSLELESSFSAGPSLIYSATGDPTGERILTAGTDSFIRIWNIAHAETVTDQSNNTFTIVGGVGTYSNVNHGSAEIGRALQRNSVVIENTGTDTLVVNGWRMIAGNVQDFTILSASGVNHIEPNGTLNIATSFQPNAEGVREAIVEIDAGGETRRITLSGTGISPILFLPPVVNFGRRLAGGNAADTSVLIRVGTTSQPVTITRTLLLGVQQGAFEILTGGGGFTLNSNQSRTISLRFAPSAAGRFAAWVEFTLSDGSTRLIRLYGEGAGDARIRSSDQTLLFNSNQCNTESSTKSFSIGNRGTSPLVIYSIDIGGVHSSEFSVMAPTTFPVSVNSGDSVDVQVRFAPQTASQKDASVVISSNAIDSQNGVTQIAIVARKDSVAFELSRTNVVFDNVNENEQAEQRITIFNTGSVPLRWPVNSTTIGAFRIEAATPYITPPGASSEVVIRFTGGTVGNEYKGTYTYQDSLCGRNIALTFEAHVRSYIGCTIDLPKTSASLGTVVQVPVRIINKVNFNRTTITEIQARFRVNGTILTPQGITSEFHPNGDRTFDVSLPIPTSGDVLATIPFAVTWGSDTASAITVDSVWVNDTVQVRVNNGQVAISDLCREGGPRLLLRNRNSAATVHRPAELRVVPQPASAFATIDLHIVESGPTTVTLVDASGRIIAVPVQRDLEIGDYLIPFDTAMLDPGTYTLHLVTRTHTMSHRFSVIR
ncbi:MAG: choice-of-anchor D domain-containing protein [Chlorobi bacterium]|nr:MAG: WD domain, G-beta repeat [Chlorobi bacterium OLB6]MBL1160542.1 choice-of-anchor D domain-containing protein [Chlorobiota bacterium]MBW7853211.1 choice-of-anchor D domain-containing protein [Candidatus Kapabacteria bacterium]MCL4276381.1 choice-of-anchor D domain-containing protein [Ignavibacteria bacterium]MBV6463095.1 hypothetical protein [Chlorobiota bacterium]